MFKKLFSILTVLLLLIPQIIIPDMTVKAETLGDVERELAKYKADYETNKNLQQQTKEEMQETQNKIAKANNDIVVANNEIIALQKEITELNEEIAKKEKEIKEIMNFFQKSTGESAYLEYMFGAKTFTDFIYRMAISEQMTDYNKRLIKEFQEKIEENNKKSQELEDKKVELQKMQQNLEALYNSLQSDLSSYIEDQVSIEEEIRMKEDAIAMYKEMGCKTDDEIDICTREKLPPTTELFRPLVSGYVTQEFGLPDYSTSYLYSIHGAIDISTYDNNTPVYAAGNGLVVAISRNQYCGNNIVYIQHVLYSGETYTTAYWHLRRVLVEEGDVVTKDTPIGIMGGAYSDHDACAMGAHVHFVVATGLYLQDYYYISTLNSRRINPRIVVNFPDYGVEWEDRLTKY